MTSPGKKINVLIADDHAISRHGVKLILSQAEDMAVAGEVENGQEAVDFVKKNEQVDVLIMDIEMPGKSGWEALLELKNVMPKLPVLILSIFPEQHYGMRFLKAGADGYLSKASTPDEVIEAIRRVYRGGKFVSANLAQKMIADLNKDADKLPHETLSEREFQVFSMISSGKKLKSIAEELSLSVNTVSTHRTRILQKMGMNSNAELIHYSLKKGLIR